MLRPFQCLLACYRSADNLKSVLIAASGASIYSFSIPDGSLLSVWPSRVNSVAKVIVNTGPSISNKESQPPEKRRKLSSSSNVSDSSSAEIVVGNGQNRGRKKSRRRAIIPPGVTKLVGTSNSKFIVAVTSEDKGIRVFSLLENGTLEQSSERHMLKRPCSVTLTTNEDTILCADKFGDVYSLPLVEESSKKSTKKDERMSKELVNVQKPKKFVPAATSLTVHTKRNQRALENQQRITNVVSKKNELTFDHQLLLGHVSLLIDLAYITLNPRSEQRRSYLLTADRDEHIRVSRGLPQAYIIEGYCLGHTEFVSKICAPPWSPETLISGGGDDFILVWNWLHGKVIQKIDLKAAVDAFKRETLENTVSEEARNVQIAISTSRIAVCKVFAISTPEILAAGASGHLVIICEGKVIPALFIYRMTSNNELQLHQCLKLEGNAIDIAIFHKQNSIVYAMDNIHYPMSISKVHEGSTRPCLGTYTYDSTSNTWAKGGQLDVAAVSINQWASSIDCSIDPQKVSETLYGMENLRKRGEEE